MGVTVAYSRGFQPVNYFLQDLAIAFQGGIVEAGGIDEYDVGLRVFVMRDDKMFNTRRA
jgi:hypothetical protein